MEVERIVPWIFLSLSILGAAIFVPLSFVSDHSSDTKSYKVPNVDIKYSSLYESNVMAMEEIVNAAKSDIKLVFVTPKDPNAIANFPRFSNSLNAAIKRGIKVKMITQSSEYKAPDGAEIRVFPNPNKLAFHVNLLLTDNTTFIPSSFFFADDGKSSFNASLRTVNYRVTVPQNQPFYRSAEAIFDYLWDLPASGSYTVAKWKYFNTPVTSNINLTWDTSKRFPMNRTNLATEAEKALDESADKRIVLSSGYFPTGKLSYKEAQITALHTRPLESIHVTDVANFMITTKKEYLAKKSYFNSIRAAQGGQSDYQMWECSANFDGTIIAASDAIVLAPCSYSDFFRDKAVILGITYKTSSIEYDRFSSFWNNSMRPYCQHLKVI